MNLGEFLSPEAGQRRRRWLDQQGEAALEGLGSFLGPGADGTLESVVRLGDMFNPVAGVGEAMAGGRQAYEGEGWDRVQGIGRASSGIAATVAPVAIAGTGAADDAARAVSEGLLGWSPARQGAADELGRFVQSEAGQIPAGGGDVVAQRGQEILDMLAAGRGSEVTDDMLDMGDGAAQARFDSYLFNNYDLPMDEASRMARAREMGGDTSRPYLHGTAGDIVGFNGETWVSEGNRLPEEYAYMRAVQGVGDPALYNVVPSYQQPFEADYLPKTVTAEHMMNEVLEQSPEYAAGRMDVGAASDRLDTIRTARRREGSGPHYARHNFWNDSRSLFGPDGAQAISNIFDDAGFDSYRMLEGGEQTIGIRNPSNIRSRFARFDPRLAHLRNLSAGAVPVTLGTALGIQPDEDRKRQLREYLQ